MRYRCARCEVELSQLYPDGEGERVSDGICLPCVAEHFPDEYEAVAERYARGGECVTMRQRVLTVLYALVCMALLAGVFFAPILFFNGKQ